MKLINKIPSETQNSFVLRVLRLGLESEPSWAVEKTSLKVQLEQFVFRAQNLKSFL